MKSLREQVAELEDLAPKDFDPESHDNFPNEDENSDDTYSRGVEHEGFHGREHYEDVAQSRLRRPVKPILGKRYAGSLVKRNDLPGKDADREQDLDGDEHDVSAEEDPFAPVDDGSDEDPFAQGEGLESESERMASVASFSVEEKRMKVVSGSVPEDEDEEIDSDEAFGEEDAEKFGAFKFLGSQERDKHLDASMGERDTVDVSRLSGGSEDDRRMNGAFMPVTGDESEESLQSSENESDDSFEGMDIDNGISDDSSDDSGITPPLKTATKQSSALDDRAALKALLSSDTAAVASSISAATSADVQKGQAVRAQYQIFDRILDARIKLQKGLTASNAISLEDDLSEYQDAIRAAEAASVELWNTITSIRHSFAEAQTQNSQSKNDKKRKRPTPVPATSSTPISALWSTSQSLSSTTLPHHRTILNKWSAKVRASNPIAIESRSRLLNNNNTTTTTTSQTSITDIIDSYLATETEKLIAQSTYTPTAHPTQDPPQPPHQQLHYTDTPFYQTLLRDLITTRSSTTITNTPTLLLDLPNKLHPSGSSSSRRQAVDTKASKGRKMRYTVHERLQNFMAAEEGASWSEAAREEFFAGLLGGRGRLDENEEGEGDGDGEGALRLFGR